MDQERRQEIIELHNQLDDIAKEISIKWGNRDIREHLEIALELLSDDIDEEFSEEEE